MKDPHYLGSFDSIEKVWDVYPHGGCPMDFVLIWERRVYWNEEVRNWGAGDSPSPIDPPDVILGDIQIDGNLSVSKKVAGGSAEFKNAEINNLVSDYIKTATIESDSVSANVVNAKLANIAESLTAKLIKALDVSTENLTAKRANIIMAIVEQLRSANYKSGVQGSGLFLGVDEDGNSRIEADSMLIRNEAIFNKLTIAELQSVGGQIVLSIANMECLRVENMDGFCRCFFDNQNGTITNKFKKYDQARCQTFDGKKMKYYWRLVVGVGTDYIDLSKTDSDGTSIPEARDSIVQLGNRVDASRQNAIILSAYGAPSIKQYDGIHSYSLDGCEVTVIGPEGNKFTGDFSIVSGDKKVRIPADLGVWSNGMACRYYDRVSHSGALWLCLVEEGVTTTSEPRVDNPIWQKQVSEGGTGYRLESFTTMGYEFYREGQQYNHTLSVRVFWNEKDTTESINPMRFKWTRVSENTQGDTVWNERHSLGGNSIDITSADLAGDTSFRCEFLDIENNNILTKTF